jgi:hypothetical protein
MKAYDTAKREARSLGLRTEEDIIMLAQFLDERRRWHQGKGNASLRERGEA